LTAVNLRQTRLVASVDLILALGGGWDSQQLPSVDQVEAGATPFSPPLPPPPFDKK
jgi:hypothetical protein